MPWSRKRYGHVRLCLETRKLYRTKRDTVRLRDKAAAQVLKEKFRLKDWTMPVRKFRTLEKAERSPWLEPCDPRIRQAHVRRWKSHRFFAREPAPTRAPGRLQAPLRGREAATS